MAIRFCALGAALVILWSATANAEGEKPVQSGPPRLIQNPYMQTDPVKNDQYTRQLRYLYRNFETLDELKGAINVNAFVAMEPVQREAFQNYWRFLS